jgi:hypothetical protein
VEYILLEICIPNIAANIYPIPGPIYAKPAISPEKWYTPSKISGNVATIRKFIPYTLQIPTPRKKKKVRGTIMVGR